MFTAHMDFQRSTALSASLVTHLFTMSVPLQKASNSSIDWLIFKIISEILGLWDNEYFSKEFGASREMTVRFNI